MPNSPTLDYSSPSTASSRWKLIALRALLVILGLAAWFATQSLIGARHTAVGHLPIATDGLLQWFSPFHDYLMTHLSVRNALLISSSLVIDLLSLFLLARAIFGPTFRPFIGLLFLFGLRQIFQAICILPAPDEMIWTHPGFPSLLVTYGVSNDLFFSGHTALAVFGAVELGRLHRNLLPLGVFITLFEISAVLALRAHWTMDVYAGAITALLISFLATPLARPIDRALAKATQS